MAERDGRDRTGHTRAVDRRINTIDAEVAGEAVRLIVGGGPAVPGRTMADKLAWLRKHGNPMRTLLMLEPRGHAGMHGALLTEPVSPNAHAGALFMNAAGFPLLSGEGVMAAVKIGLEHNLIASQDEQLSIDTPAGLVRAQLRGSSVTLSGVPSFVHAPGIPVTVGSRKVSADVAFGGEFYAVADSEAVGIPVDMSHGLQLVRMALDLGKAIESAVSVGIHGVIFTALPRAAADLRSATVLDGQVVRRSPGVAGTAALLAVLDAMGLVMEGATFTHEGILGTTVSARVGARQLQDEKPAIVPILSGAASITGFHEFVY